MTDSSKLIGWEALSAFYSSMAELTPEGVNFKRDSKAGKTYLYLQFRIPGGKRYAKPCACDFTEDGIRKALMKAQKVAEALTKFSTESEFWAWYDSEILEKNRIENDLITFGEAIKRVEDDFWASQTRTKGPRDRNNPSHQASWDRVYWDYYKHLPAGKAINLSDIMTVLERWRKGTKSYKEAAGAMRKLARLAENTVCIKALSKIKSKQTEFREDLQTIDIDKFLEIRDAVLGITQELHPNCKLDSRKSWIWVFSMQMVYGLRIHEVFAILNLTKPFKTPDGVTIPALNDPNNKTNVIVIGALTEIGTTTKTGYRLAAPIPHPRHPNLIERLEIKACRKPNNKPREDSKPETKAGFYCSIARKKLVDWHLGLTQTHALRHLANMNGHISGLSSTALAQSLGHSVQMNENTYTKRAATKTKLDLLLNSQKQPLTLASAILATKTLLMTHTSRVAREAVIDLLAAIYHEDAEAIADMLR